MNLAGKLWRTSKALAAFPVVAWKSLFTTQTLHLSDWFRGLKASWSNPTYLNLAKKAHRNPFASRAIHVISRNMASVVLTIVKMVGEGDDAKEDALTDHPALQLLKRPNRRQTYRHFIDAIVNHLYLGGELFIERRGPVTGRNAGRAQEIHLHRPDRFVDFIRMGRHPQGFLELLEPETRRMAAEGDIIGYWITDQWGKPHSYTTDQVHHVRIYNPTDEDRGLPILLGGIRALETMEAADDWNKNIASGSGRVPGYFNPTNLQNGQQLSEDQVKAAEDNLDERVKERRKSYLPMVLSGAYEYIEGSISPKDADFLETDKNNARKIAAVTGVPAMLLGDEKQGSLTDAGLDSEVKALMILTVLPILEFLLDELTEWLLPPFGENISYGYDKDQIEALQEDMTEKYRRYKEACGAPFISRDEAREATGWKTKGGEFEEIVTPLGSRVGGQNMDPEAGDEPEPLRRLRSASEDDLNHLLKEIAA